MKKKLLALVLATAMTLSLASCGGSKTETPSTGSDNSSASSDNFSAEGATIRSASASWCSTLRWTLQPRVLSTL